MTLDHWLNSKDMNAEAFGRLIGVTGQAVRRYRTGERMPDAETVDRINKATDGEVTVSEMHETRMQWIRSHAGQDAENSEAAA